MNDSVLTIPHDFEAEQAVLGSLIFNNSNIVKILRIIKANDFHTENHNHIFKAITDLDSRNEPADEITIGNQLKSMAKLDEIGGYSYLAELVDCIPSTGSIEFWASIIKQESVARQIIKLSSDMNRKVRDPQQSIIDLLVEYQNKLTDISADTTRKPARHIKECIAENVLEFENLTSPEPIMIGLPTGLTDLDDKIIGLLPTDLILIASRPGMGKTALALNMADNIHKRKKDIGATIIFTREMADIQLSKRLLTSHGMFDIKKLKDEKNYIEWDKLSKSMDDLSVAPIYIDESTGNIDQLVFETKNLHKTLKNGVSLVICDYAQLMEGPKKSNREQEIGYISRKMKLLAMDLKIPVVLLSQLNREVDKRSNKIPQISDLRESGTLEQDADIIIFIYRDEVYNEKTDKKGIADLVIAKHRNGPTGACQLSFSGRYLKFDNLSRFQQPKI